jgi:isopenicillin N synthase-like dioxygenase
VDEKKQRGVEATNRDFIHHEQVDKDQSYRLAEGGEERFDEDFRVRTCDMRRWFSDDPAERAAFAGELGGALEEIGFAILVGHGVDPALYEEAERRVVDMIGSTPLDQKLQFRAQRHGSVNQGYFPVTETADIHPDLVEGWVFCRRAFAIDQPDLDVSRFWPAPEHEAFFRRLCLAHEALILPIAQAMLTHLGQDPHAFDERLTRTNFGLRLNYYPPVTDEQDASGAGRLLGHEDVNLFTILPAPSVEGLQALDRRSMAWVRVQAPPGSIILNTGDYMQRITNDRFPSTTHRVSKPRDAALLRRPRASFPMNVYLWEHELLEVLPGLGEPRYEPIEAITFHTRTTSKYYGDDYAVDT